MKILAINPGSTSTKLALYEDDREVFTETLDHPVSKIERYFSIQDQFEFRKEVVINCLERNGENAKDLSAVVGRGGMLPPIKSGAYEVNEAMVDFLSNNPVSEHASNLGALIAYEIASPFGIPAYIYDSVSVDELSDIARFSGMPVISRTSTSHALNSRAMAHKLALKYGKKYQDMNFVVAHLGGGISLSAHEKGKMIDIVSDDEGPFSPERSGRVPCNKLIDLCFSGQYDKNEVKKLVRGKGGLGAYLGTIDAREVESQILKGDPDAKAVYEAMAYQVSKSIGEMASVLSGNVDAVIITGGIAYSKMMTDWIVNRVSYIGRIEIMPGENELEALALGTLRVLRGEELAHQFKA